jgi:hypothetical protein
MLSSCITSPKLSALPSFLVSANCITLIVYLLIGKSKFRCGIECKVAIIILLIEILLELMVIKFLLLVPISNSGGGIESIGNIVVMHAVILFIENQR